MVLSSYFGYFIILSVSILGAMSSSSLLLQWACLEVNMLAVIPLFNNQGESKSSEVAVKYFISQSAVSVWIILSYMLSSVSPVFNFFIQLALLFKLGVPPFHGWMLSLLLNLNYFCLLLILTLQKLIPLSMMSESNLSSLLILLAMTISGGVVLGMMLNISMVYYLILMSSIVNSFWLLSTMKFSGVWFEFMVVYSTMLMSLILFLDKLAIYKLSDLSKLTLPSLLLLSFNLMNLGGIPPMLGFLLKLMMIKSMVFFSSPLIVSMLGLALMILFIYASFIYAVYTYTPAATILSPNASFEGYSWVLTISITGSSFMLLLH